MTIRKKILSGMLLASAAMSPDAAAQSGKGKSPAVVVQQLKSRDSADFHVDENKPLGELSIGADVIRLHNALDYMGYMVKDPQLSHMDGKAEWNLYDGVESAWAVGRFQMDHDMAVTGKADRDTLRRINKALDEQAVIYDKIVGEVPGLTRQELLDTFQHMIREKALELTGLGEKPGKNNEGLVELGFMPSYADKEAWCAGFADALRQLVAKDFGIEQRLCTLSSKAGDCISVYKHQIQAGKDFHAARDAKSGKYTPKVGDILLLNDDSGRPMHSTTIVALQRDDSEQLSYLCIGGNIRPSPQLDRDIVGGEAYPANEPHIRGFVDNFSLFAEAFKKKYPGRVEEKGGPLSTLEHLFHRHGKGR